MGELWLSVLTDRFPDTTPLPLLGEPQAAPETPAPLAPVVHAAA